MNYLAIDTSGFHLTVIAKGENGRHVYFNENCSLKHSVVVMPAIEEALERANLKKEDVDVFCCCLGPGSFTGIRIGVASVKGLAYALKKKVLGVTAFDALAYNKATGKMLTVIDAKHAHVYAAAYDGDREILSPCYISTEQATEIGKACTVLSQGEIEGLETQTVSLCDGFLKAVEAKLGEATYDLESLVPLYVRKSQAEENR